MLELLYLASDNKKEKIMFCMHVRLPTLDYFTNIVILLLRNNSL